MRYFCCKIDLHKRITRNNLYVQSGVRDNSKLPWRDEAKWFRGSKEKYEQNDNFNLLRKLKCAFCVAYKSAPEIILFVDSIK